VTAGATTEPSTATRVFHGYGVALAQPLENKVTDGFNLHDPPPHLTMRWLRRLATPMRESFPADARTSDELLDLLEQAERRISRQKQAT
jgi:hypothetical protein